LGFKDITEGFFVPRFESLLEFFEFLLEFVHLGAMWDGCLLLPSVGIELKIWVVETKPFEYEGFAS